VANSPPHEPGKAAISWGEIESKLASMTKLARLADAFCEGWRWVKRLFNSGKWFSRLGQLCFHCHNALTGQEAFCQFARPNASTPCALKFSLAAWIRNATASSPFFRVVVLVFGKSGFKLAPCENF
jgi:hypothetical protein